MKNIVKCFLGVIVLLLTACAEPEFKKGEGMLQYKIVEDKGGQAIGKVSTVFLTYIESIENGKILSKTGEFDPQLIEVYATYSKFEGDLQNAFQYLSEGDSAIVKVSLDSIKRFNQSPLLVKDTSKYLTYTLRIHRVINQEGESDPTYLLRVKSYENEIKQKRKTEERQKIKKYLEVNKLNYKETITGLLYPENLKTVNNDGQQLYVRYTLTSLDGLQFSSKYEKIKPEQARFAGLKQALQITPKGSKNKFIIPSHLAYGEVGDHYKMGPYTPIICEFTILNK